MTIPSKIKCNISVLTPVYGQELDLYALYTRIVKNLEPITKNFEIIMVNDSSPDNAWTIIEKLAKEDKRVRGINLSRNFGQHCAITAGLDYVRGDWCVVMDCDLQDRPEEIKKFYSEAKKGYDIVMGRRVVRRDNFFKRLSSKLFYILFNYLTGQKYDNRIANFGIYSRRSIEAIKSLKEKDRSFGLLALWIGFKRTEIDIEHGMRKVGKSAYTFSNRLNIALDHILSHSNRPLKLFVKWGFLISFVSSLYMTYLIIDRLIFHNSSIIGWTSLMVALFFFSGLLMTVIGMVGLYVGKIYDEVKKRPLYIVMETTF